MWRGYGETLWCPPLRALYTEAVMQERVGEVEPVGR